MEHASKDLCRRRLRSPGPAPANYVKMTNFCEGVNASAPARRGRIRSAPIRPLFCALPAAWHRRADETSAAHLAFRAYLDVGPGRTVFSAYKAAKERRKDVNRRARQIRSAPSRWYRWAEAHAWTERADAYDAHVQREVIAETSRIVVLLPERTIARRSGRVGVGYGQNMGRMTKNCEGGAG